MRSRGGKKSVAERRILGKESEARWMSQESMSHC
jgi:hypothetical protein